MRAAAMLCLLCIACWHTVVAGETELVPSNHTTEYSSIVSTTSSDPWSSVVGDTEGSLAVNDRATGLSDGIYGRRAAFSLVENIRKQLMRDNYDYINDSEETNSPDDAKTVRTTSTRTMSIPSSTTTPSISTVYSYLATRLLPPFPTESKLPGIQMQVASVRIPVKSVNGKSIQPYDDSPRLRSIDEVSQSHATKMTNNIEHKIKVSKKDLLYYIDDSHLRRKNAGMVQRRKYNSSDLEHRQANRTILISTNGSKQEKNEKHKIIQRNYLHDNHSDTQQNAEYDFNKNGRRSNQLINKTRSKNNYFNDQNDVKYADDLSVNNDESGKDNQYNSKDIEHTENVPRNGHNNTRHHKEGDVEFDDKNIITKSCSYSDQSNESQDSHDNDKENTSVIKQYQQLKRIKKIKNITQTSPSSDQRDTIQKVKVSDEKQVHENEQIDSEQSNHQIFRRKNQLRKEKKIKHKLIRPIGNRQNTNLLGHKQKLQKNKKIKRNNRAKTKNRQQRIQQQTRQQNKIRQTKKTKKNRHQSKKGLRKKKIKPISKYSRKNNDISDLYGKSHELEGQNKASDVLDSQVDEAHDKTVIKTGNLSDIKEDHGQHSQNENDKIVDGTHDYTDGDELKKDDHNGDLDDNLHNDTPHDQPKGEHNTEQQEQGDKKAYVDSIDNEEFDGFNGRRMNNDDRNYTQHVDRSDNHCNDSQLCDNQKDEIHKQQDGNQHLNTKKYKLLKIPSKGGSRRNNREQRRILQERDSKGLVLYAVDEGPFPQFRLPRDRRQYMDDHVDKRPPLLEQISKKSSDVKHSGRRYSRD